MTTIGSNGAGGPSGPRVWVSSFNVQALLLYALERHLDYVPVIDLAALVAETKRETYSRLLLPTVSLTGDLVPSGRHPRHQYAPTRTPAKVVLHVPDGLVEMMEGEAKKRDVLLFVQIPREVLDEFLEAAGGEALPYPPCACTHRFDRHSDTGCGECGCTAYQPEEEGRIEETPPPVEPRAAAPPPTALELALAFHEAWRELAPRFHQFCPSWEDLGDISQRNSIAAFEQIRPQFWPEMERQRISAEYRDAHSCCPRCGSDQGVSTTLVGHFFPPDTNRATCSVCDWFGIAHELVAPGTVIPSTEPLSTEKEPTDG